MKYEFEGKGYVTISQIHREWFPTRSNTWVGLYIKMGCKTVAEVVDLNIKREREARVKTNKNAKEGYYRATNESVVGSVMKNKVKK